MESCASDITVHPSSFTQINPICDLSAVLTPWEPVPPGWPRTPSVASLSCIDHCYKRIFDGWGFNAQNSIETRGIHTTLKVLSYISIFYFFIFYIKAHISPSWKFIETLNDHTSCQSLTALFFVATYLCICVCWVVGSFALLPIAVISCDLRIDCFSLHEYSIWT